jgi:DegV family protein with EDD domain
LLRPEQAVDSRTFAWRGEAQVAQQVAIVSDTSVDLPAQLAKERGVFLAPLGYEVGGRHFRTDQQANQAFLASLNGAIAAVEGVSAEDYEATMRAGAASAKDVVCLCQTVGSSFTRVSAEVAVRHTQLDNIRVELISPGRSTLGLGALCLAAAKRAASGGSTDEVFAFVERASMASDTYAIPRDLRYLERSGELALLSSQSTVGRIDEGIPLFRVRGRVSAAAATADHASAEDELFARVTAAAGSRPAVVVVGHAAAAEAAERLAARAHGALRVSELHIVEMGPTIASVLGAGAYGLGFCAPEQQ